MLANTIRGHIATSKTSYVVMWRGDGSIAAQSAATPADITMPERRSGMRMYSADRTRGQFKELYRALPFGDIVLIGRSIAPEMASLRTVRLSLIAAGLTIWVLGLAGGWWLTTRALRTVEVISETAEKIAAGDLSQRVQVANTDSELGRLANVLNSTFARLDLAFQQQARFTADASHELRTPISVVLAQTQSALARERPAAEYREALEACSRAAQRMRQLVESLLQLARLDAEQEHTRRHPVDLAAIAEECVEFIRPMSDMRGIRITVDLQKAVCIADPQQITQVATNLFTNAVQCNRESGEIRISTGVKGELASLVVMDTGDGIPAEDLPSISIGSIEWINLGRVQTEERDLAWRFAEASSRRIMESLRSSANPAPGAHLVLACLSMAGQPPPTRTRWLRRFRQCGARRSSSRAQTCGSAIRGFR